MLKINDKQGADNFESHGRLSVMFLRYITFNCILFCDGKMLDDGLQ